MSLLANARVIADEYATEFIDGNLIDDPASTIVARAQATGAKLLAVSVMPGPQLREAVPVCRRIKAEMPGLLIVWGGYFPTQHHEVVVSSSAVDFVIAGQGEAGFRSLVEVVYRGGSLSDVPSLIYQNGVMTVNPRAPLTPLDAFPAYPYDRLDVAQYLGKSYLGRRVLSHNSSFGCPFACNFCAVVALARQRWLPESAARVANTVQFLHANYGIDGLEFHDMDFFVHEERAVEIASRIESLGIEWWGLGRIDTLMSYSDASWAQLKRSGLKMVFVGAESGDDDTLIRMNKGGKSSTALTLAFVERMKHVGIVPELSFVLGNPPDPNQDVDASIRFIRQIKNINPATELVLYIYTPVPQEGSILLDEATRLGFRFPETLEEWASEEWATFALRRDPGTPWLRDNVRRKVRDFEAVVNAYYPTVTDIRLNGHLRRALRAISGWRYRLEYYQWPYELKVLQRLVHYRRPETTGF